ncbi:MAG: cation:proton antiporter, partial [Candidatus Eremiobacteraeota bacterium]|nr:cation:proton antiporter [Candidatus Eremiobacteraeota bacterium]
MACAFIYAAEFGHLWQKLAKHNGSDMIAPTIAHLLFLFLIVVAVAIATRYARVPYTVGLVIAGLLIGLLPRRAEFSLTPDLVMFVFLPALLFAGCWTLPLSVLRRNWLPVTLFATAGVFIGMLVARLVLVWGAHFSPSAAWLFGAIIAATDPVAVIAIFRSLRGNEELATILEGESLFNDATAVVAFKITLLVSLSAAPTVWFAPVADFVVLCAGGILVGAVIGVLALLFLR